MIGADRPSRVPGRTIPEAFEAAAAAYGDRIALVADGSSCTFSELDRRANGVARIASRTMVVPGERAVVLTDSRPAATAAFLGLCKAGMVSLLLRVGQPVPYLRTILADAGARVIFATREHRALAESLCPVGGDVVDLDSDCPVRDEPPGRSPRPEDPVGIAYTSGSTGRPKGVVQTHRSTLAFACSYLSRTRLRQDDRVALLHDSRAMDLVSSLMIGATACSFAIDRQGLTGLAEWLVNQRITVLPTVPSVLRHIVKALAGRRDELSVRLLRLSGEVLAPDDLRQAAAVFPPSCRVLNWFGSTEVAVASCSLPLEEMARMSTIPAGRPFDGVHVAIEDPDGVQTNGTGEIVVSGDALFAGYWRRPDLDAQKLSPDPDRAGYRRFRTGDAGYLDASGRLIVVGRVDDQLKVNGYRVEAAEVEAALRSVPGIEDAVVRLARPEGDTESALAAYVLTRGGEPPLVGFVRRELEKKIPRYMIPEYFARVDSIPRLVGGKPDRRALPELVPRSRREYNPLAPSKGPGK
ncbi:MAG: AMP-binding protein [Arenicellales bacterium]